MSDPVSSGPEPRAPSPDLSEEPPPFGGSWRALYAVVAATLALLIALFAMFTKAFE
jgi:hypothetical protein